jgi:hypothetical protein
MKKQTKCEERVFHEKAGYNGKRDNHTDNNNTST